MDAQATRATAAIISLALLSVGAGWLYDVVSGPPQPSALPPPADEVLTLVGFPLQKYTLATATLRFTGDGALEFEAIDLPFANVTSFSVVLRASMRGPSVGDTYDVQVIDPIGQVADGQQTNQASPNGYVISRPVISAWPRGEPPENKHFATSSEDTALAWAAENWTDGSSRGKWQATVNLSPPVTPLRQGNASLLFEFFYYEAIAFPPTSDDGTPVAEPGRPPATSAPASAAPQSASRPTSRAPPEHS